MFSKLALFASFASLSFSMEFENFYETEIKNNDETTELVRTSSETNEDKDTFETKSYNSYLPNDENGFKDPTVENSSYDLYGQQDITQNITQNIKEFFENNSFLDHLNSEFSDEMGNDLDKNINGSFNIDFDSFCNSSKTVKTVVVGGSAALIAHFLSHPFDVAKTHKQSNQNIVKGEGIDIIKHFYDGYMASMSKNVIKGICKMIGMTEFRDKIRSQFSPETPLEYTDSLTAIIWGLTATSLMTPAERIKSYRITSEKDIKNSIWKELMEKNQNNAYKTVKELYKGSSALLAKESFGKFLDLHMVCKNKDAQKCEKLSSSEVHYKDLLNSITQSIISTLVLMPADNIKTLMQKCDAKNNGFFETGKQIVGNKGFIGLWTGGLYRFAGHILGNFVNNKAYDLIAHDKITKKH